MSGEAPLLIALGLLLVLSVFLAAAEAALVRMPRVRAASLAAKGGHAAQRLAALVEDLPRVLNAILLAALLAQIGAATVVGVLAQRWFGNLGVTLASVVLTLVLFVYGEAIPKTYAVRHPDLVAVRLASSVGVLERILRPIVKLLLWIADLQMPGKGITTPTVTEDELRRLASRAAVEGEITETDRELIERAFRFGDRRTDDIMVPRPDIVGVPAESSVEVAIEVALKAGHRRLPVFDGSIENVIGVVKLRDLVRAQGEGTSVAELAEKPLVVPESKRIIDLLELMQRSRKHLAVVVDEYGGTAGLVTVEDVVEELLGTISEEEGTAHVRQMGEDHWIISAALPVSDLAELIGADLPDGDYTTVAGLMMANAGEVLDVGDEVEVAGRRLIVTEVRRRRITEVEIRPPQ